MRLGDVVTHQWLGRQRATQAADARSRRIAGYRLWIGYFGVIALFGLLREAANYSGVPTQYAYAPAVDRMLGWGLAPTIRLQSLRTPLLDWVAIATWLSFFIFPHLVAWIAFRRGKLRRYIVSLAAFLTVALVVHLLVPTAPPWLAAPHGDMPPVQRVLKVWGEQISPAVYAAGNATAGSNPVAAMPSVHVGWVTIAVLALDAPVAIALAYAAVMTLALSYLGEHFVIDGIIGFLLALMAHRMSRRYFGDASGLRSGGVSGLRRESQGTA
jgi:hypothetical protein